VCFLSEAIASNEHAVFCPLAECAILVTICGRAMSHRQVSNVERAYGNTPHDFWVRHEWLDGMINRRLDALMINYPVVSAVGDPMLLFAFMLAQTTVIYLTSIMEGLGQYGPYQPTVAEHQTRAVRAAREIARLSKVHEQVGYIKVSFLAPVQIMWCPSDFRTGPYISTPDGILWCITLDGASK